MIYVQKSDSLRELVSTEAVAGESLAKQLHEELGEIIAFKCANTGEFFDMQQLIHGPITLIPITKEHSDFMDILRHDCEHLLAQAVLELWPDCKLAVGAAMNKGFGYDFLTDIPFTLNDFEKIEQRMREIINRKTDIIREMWNIEDAKDFYREQENGVKLEVLERLEKQGVSSVSLYKHVEGNECKFVDLCRGPHGQSLCNLSGMEFKLLSLSAVHKEGHGEMQRICGVLFEDQKLLEEYLEKLEAAKEGDHRKLAKKMDLFHIAEHSSGLPFWHPNGWSIVLQLQKYMRRLMQKSGYVEVNTPGMLNVELWKRSGHWDKFKDNMFCVHCGDDELALKPMNCPAHVEIFKSHFLGGVKSYAMLPVRMSEFGEVYRNEPTGGLQGLKRVRRFVQDDGHIFCTPEQIEQEIVLHCELFRRVYSEFGFNKYHIELSTRPDEKIGDEQMWDKAEEALAQGAEAAGFSYKLAPKGGAFYGPKLDFHVFDALDRQWQCCTVQLDFNLPKRLGADYIDSTGTKQTPVMIHRAVYGSIERFLALVLENTKGWLPMWVAPVQVMLLPMSDAAIKWCDEFAEKLREHDIRVEVDARNEKLGYKVREHTIQRVCKLVVIGKKELDAGTVAVKCGKTGEQVVMTADECLKAFAEEGAVP